MEMQKFLQVNQNIINEHKGRAHPDIRLNLESKLEFTMSIRIALTSLCRERI